VIVVVFSLALTSMPSAWADEYKPTRAVFRPSLGWVCWPRRATGDFDGNGRPDHAVVWDRVGPHGRCDEFHPTSRWHVALLLGNGERVQRPLPCDQGPGFCNPAAGDLDNDGRDELFVEDCCGAIIVTYRVYRLVGTRLVRPQVVPPVAGGIRPGPLAVSFIGDSGTHDGFGCRTHPSGVRILVAWTGRLGRPGHWKFERGRFRLEGGLVRLLGVRRFRMWPHGRWPRGLHVSSCLATP
jgi:hypothetical protein